RFGLVCSFRLIRDYGQRTKKLTVVSIFWVAFHPRSLYGGMCYPAFQDGTSPYFDFCCGLARFGPDVADTHSPLIPIRSCAMLLFDWLGTIKRKHRWSAGKSKSSRLRARTRRPQVEALEDRFLPSIVVGPNVNISRSLGNQNE